MSVFAYNILSNTWREILTSINIQIMTKDESANILVFDTTDSKIYSSGEKESVKFSLKTKTFVSSDERKEVVRYIYVTYCSATDLTVNLFVEGGGSAVWTGNLPLSNSVITKKLAIRYRAMKFLVEILDDVASNTDSEINKILLEHT